MDFQHRAVSKTGSGAPLSHDETNIERRERLRKLALETIDLAKDPYFMRNHLGQYECKLCLTIHLNEGSYLVHTQGKKHQSNLARRAAKESLHSTSVNGGGSLISSKPQVKKHTGPKIGRPGYRVTKVKDITTHRLGLLFQIEYPEITKDMQPKHRFMSSYEQHVETPDKAYQYILFAADPYETIAFKVLNGEVDRHEDRLIAYWDSETRQYTLQFFYNRIIFPQAIPM
jgi:splicing factor 3A subunit 2